MIRSTILALASLAIVAPVATAQQPVGSAPERDGAAAASRSGIEHADSLYDARQFDAAREAYRTALEADPTSSRAIFRLGQLSEGDEAIDYFRRYTELEPDDAWGWITLAEVLSDEGELYEALEAYDVAVELTPDERDAVLGRARLLIVELRILEARSALDGWVTRHASDAEAWRLLARAHRLFGDVDGEIDALEHLAELAPNDDSHERLAALNSRTAAAIEPSLATSTDSDGNGVTRVGLSGDLGLSRASRLGIQLERVTATGDGEQSLDRGLLYYSLRGADLFRLDARAGVAMLESGKGRASKSSVPIGRLRARWAGDSETVGAELRLQRSLQDATPELIESRVVLEEALGAVEIPIGESLQLNLRGSGGALVEGSKRNWRFRLAGGPQMTVAEGVRLGAQYEATAYSARATGYFAPSLAHTIEATASAEIEELGDFSLAAEAGAGVQQIIEEKGGAGTLSPALRGWGSAAWNFAPSSALALELEAYNLVGGASVASGSGGWSYLSAMLTLRWAL